MRTIAALVLGLLIASPAAGQTSNPLWAGYVCGTTTTGHACTNSPTAGVGWTSASMTYRVPAMQIGIVTPGTQEVTVWAGVGGDSAPGTLIQSEIVGTLTTSGVASYQAVWESYEGGVRTSNGGMTGAGTIQALDVVSVSVTCTVNCTPQAVGQKWTLVMRDLTQGWVSTVTNVANANDLSTAEWISESPASGGPGLPVPNYGSIPFISVQGNGGDPGLVTAAQFFTTSSNNTVQGPSNNAGAAFNICWGNTTVPACSTWGTVALASGNSKINGF